MDSPGKSKKKRKAIFVPEDLWLLIKQRAEKNHRKIVDELSKLKTKVSLIDAKRNSKVYPFKVCNEIQALIEEIIK